MREQLVRGSVLSREPTACFRTASQAVLGGRRLGLGSRARGRSLSPKAGIEICNVLKLFLKHLECLRKIPVSPEDSEQPRMRPTEEPRVFEGVGGAPIT